MRAKGLAVQPIPLFIKANFSIDDYEMWLGRLSAEAQDIFRNKIHASQWYSMKYGIIEPDEKLCQLFYDNDVRGAWASGMYSAEHGLTGILKFFVKLGSPQFIIKQANRIIPHYYSDSEMSCISCTKNSAVLRITRFDMPHPMIEAGICGFIEEALLICGVHNISISIEKSLTRNDDCTEFHFTWN